MELNIKISVSISLPDPEAEKTPDQRDFCAKVSAADTGTKHAAKPQAGRPAAPPEGPGSAGLPPVRLRPHHLLCTQSYSGTGYDDAFKLHMDEIVRRLRTETRTPVTLVFSTDELCSACPNRLGEDHCRTNEKVKALDRKTAECFHLEEKTYIYQDLVRHIRRMATPELMDYICGTCAWYPVSACRERILGSKSGSVDVENQAAQTAADGQSAAGRYNEKTPPEILYVSQEGFV